MEDTNCGDNCCFVKSGFCKTDKECPFYVESWWIETGKEVPKQVKDCHTKRSSLQQAELHSRMIAMQQSQEQLRNRLSNIENLLAQLIAQSKEFLLEEKEKSLKLDNNEYKKIEAN